MVVGDRDGGGDYSCASCGCCGRLWWRCDNVAVVMLIVGVMQEVVQCGGGGDVDSGVCEKV